MSSFVEQPSEEAGAAVITALTGVSKVQKNAKLTTTYGLAEEIARYFGPEFNISANRGVLGKIKQFCRPTTAQPDTLLHHMMYYVCKDTFNVGESDDKEQQM